MLRLNNNILYKIGDGELRSWYISKYAMFITIFMLLFLFNITKGNLVINLKVYLGLGVLMGIFIVQTMLFFYTVYKYKNNKCKYTMINLKKSMIHVIFGIITIISGLGMILYNTENLFFKILLVIMGIELIIIRLSEVNVKKIEKFSEFNFNFTPIVNLEMLKNKKIDNLYNKNSKLIYPIAFASISTGFFLIIYSYIFNPAKIFLIFNLIIIFLINYFINLENLFFLDKLLKNYIMIDFKYLKTIEFGGAHPGSYSNYVYINDSLKVEVSLDILRSLNFKKSDLTLIIGGISHRVIEIL